MTAERLKRSIALPAILAALWCFAALAQDESSVEGIWINADGDGWIELRIVAGNLQGRIIGSPNDPDNSDPSRLDIENPDPALRARPLRGLLILEGVSLEGVGRWTGGRVYDP